MRAHTQKHTRVLVGASCAHTTRGHSAPSVHPGNAAALRDRIVARKCRSPAHASTTHTHACCGACVGVGVGVRVLQHRRAYAVPLPTDASRHTCATPPPPIPTPAEPLLFPTLLGLQSELFNLLESEELAKTPIMVFANKQVGGLA